ncbi:hypothetical protein [Deinococcus marmoris]|uniref:hypothetical protein n=1 Tax=Deinococcus marmoris TaxID=249408 RepID=UPI000B05DF0B|nr:hypothetical protein [Deinococcus marmoris]
MLLQKKLNFTTVEDSNSFLRCLWSTIRTEHLEVRWQTGKFKPVNNTINLGYIQIENLGTFGVKAIYEQRGIVKILSFESKEDDSKEEIVRLIDTALRNYKNSEMIYRHTFFFKSMRERFGNIEGKNFKISTYSDGNLLSIPLRGYDSIDAFEKYREYVQPILDVLAALTNLPWWLDNVTGDELNMMEIDFEGLDENGQPWIDGLPMIDGYIQISDVGKKLIDKVLELGFEDQNVSDVVNSCHHFHLARKMECIAFDSIITRVVASSEDFTLVDIDESNPFLSIRPILPESSELAVSLYCSSLEALSKLEDQPVEKCDDCGQLKFSVKKRVMGLVSKILNESISKEYISPMYDRRSKYLHTGNRTIERYIGSSNPQLDPLSRFGVREVQNINSLNLREYVSYCIRDVIGRTYN